MGSGESGVETGGFDLPITGSQLLDTLIWNRCVYKEQFFRIPAIAYFQISESSSATNRPLPIAVLVSGKSPKTPVLLTAFLQSLQR